MTGPIYTGRGDDGETSLVGGGRVKKNSLRVEAYGVLDEVSSHVGLARVALARDLETDALLAEALGFVQHRLFDCSSLLATPPDAESASTPRVSDGDVARMEGWIDEMTRVAGDAGGFVLPGGCETAARLHVARTVARRGELAILDLNDVEHIRPALLAFVNRLSDLLFAGARYANKVTGTVEEGWGPSGTER